MYQRNNTKTDNRRSYIIHQNHFTFQRKGNNEFAIQALNIIVADLQTQKIISIVVVVVVEVNRMKSVLCNLINYVNFKNYNHYIHEYVGTDIRMYHLINP